MTSARPEVRGTTDVGWRSLFPLPINLLRTHSRLHHHTSHVFGPTGSVGHEWLNDADAGGAPFSLPFVVRGCCTSRASCDHLVRPPTRTTTGYADRHQPTGPHDHISDRWSKLTWDTISAGGHDL